MKDKRQRMALAWPYGIVDPNVYAYIMNAAASLAHYPHAGGMPGAAHLNYYASVGLQRAAAAHLPHGLPEGLGLRPDALPAAALAGTLRPEGLPTNPLAGPPVRPTPTIPHPALLAPHLPGMSPIPNPSSLPSSKETSPSSLHTSPSSGCSSSPGNCSCHPKYNGLSSPPSGHTPTSQSSLSGKSRQSPPTLFRPYQTDSD